jgi:hypothetical protein
MAPAAKDFLPENFLDFFNVPAVENVFQRLVPLERGSKYSCTEISE